jgi:hypothetical protein
VYRPCLLRLWSYRAGLLLQRWQHVLIQAASPLWASHPFPHFHTFLPVLQAPSSLRPNFGRFAGSRDGATATYHGGGNSDIILLCQVELRDSRLQNIVRWVEKWGKNLSSTRGRTPAVCVGSRHHRFYTTVVSVFTCLSQL